MTLSPHHLANRCWHPLLRQPLWPLPRVMPTVTQPRLHTAMVFLHLRIPVHLTALPAPMAYLSYHQHDTTSQPRPCSAIGNVSSSTPPAWACDAPCTPKMARSNARLRAHSPSVHPLMTLLAHGLFQPSMNLGLPTRTRRRMVTNAAAHDHRGSWRSFAASHHDVSPRPHIAQLCLSLPPTSLAFPPPGPDSTTSGSQPRHAGQRSSAPTVDHPCGSNGQHTPL